MAETPTADNPTRLEVTTETTHKHRLPMGILDFVLDNERDILYAACMDGVYEMRTEDGEYRRLYEHESYASGVVQLPNSPTLISAGYDGQLIWYDVEQQQIFRRIQAHDFWSWQMALSPTGSRLATVTGQYLAGSDKYDPAPEKEPSVKVYDTLTGRLVHALPHVPCVQAVAFSPDGAHVAAGNLMGQIRVWNVDDGQLVSDWTTDAFTSWGIIKSHCYIGGIHALAFAPDGSALLAAGMGPMRDPMAGNGRQLWQRFHWQGEQSGKLIDQTNDREAGEGLMETLAFHPSGSCFLMGGRLRGGDWNAAIFATEDGHRLHHGNSGFRMTSAIFSRDGGQLITAGFDGQKGPKDGKYPHFGVVHVDQLETNLASA